MVTKHKSLYDPTATDEDLHASQKFELPPFWNGLSYGIKKYGVEVTFNGMTSIPNFIKVYKLVQMLLIEDT
jgi:hypothetical protein